MCALLGLPDPRPNSQNGFIAAKKVVAQEAVEMIRSLHDIYKFHLIFSSPTDTLASNEGT